MEGLLSTGSTPSSLKGNKMGKTLLITDPRLQQLATPLCLKKKEKIYINYDVLLFFFCLFSTSPQDLGTLTRYQNYCLCACLIDCPSPQKRLCDFIIY